MTFKRLEFSHNSKFNSAVSLDFLDSYNQFVSEQILAERSKPKHKSFAPSSIRCDRISWFRLRGVQPDTPEEADKTLQFAADIGTACHRIIQTNLKNMLGDDWIDVGSYLKTIEMPSTYSVEVDPISGETLVTLDNPPIRFACDGIVRIKDELYLLEIKSAEYNSWNSLTTYKPQHKDQVVCYSGLLKLHKVLFVYIDRWYGDIKCYEETIPEYLQQEMFDKMVEITKLAECGIAPEPLPKNDSWCCSGMCPYFKKCKEYGR